MSKTIGQELAERLKAAFEEKMRLKARPKPKLDVVAESDVQAKEVRVGLARPVGDVLAKLDPEMPEGTRFTRARVVVPAEELYWQEVDRLFNRRPGVTVRFEYNPFTRFDAEIPSCHREKGK